MIIVIQNNTNKSNYFGYVEQPTRIFVNHDVDYSDNDYWYDYCTNPERNNKTFIEYIESLGFLENKNFYELCL